ncbi:MAG: tRNA (N6-threonylcarbamoyladenosine(37)-N6)-methyltransferase TrmO [Anaerolineales bacterium]|nr:tRNA (N6-threonylcarbamoyladenosine(37)-N6)-methyltransferase TrmO [Anaerolineales bacterium]
MKTIRYTPIGLIHSPFSEPVGVPIQPTAAAGLRGSVEIFPAFVPGLQDLEGFSHIVLLFHLHRSSGYELQVVPFLDKEKRGVFSTRAPHRPNQIGLSIVKLISVEESILHIEGVDVLDGTPLLDIKPYFPALNPGGEIRIGWAEKLKSGFRTTRADNRFAESPGTEQD